MGKFEASVKQWSRKAGKELERDTKSIALNLFGSIVDSTPVDEGRLKGNWQFSIGSPMRGEVRSIDPSGAETKRKIESGIKSLKLVDNAQMYLANNLPYAYRIEYERYSSKAPDGMVRKNFIRIKNNIRARYER